MNSRPFRALKNAGMLPASSAFRANQCPGVSSSQRNGFVPELLPSDEDSTDRFRCQTS